MNIKFIVLVFLGIFFGCLGLSKLAHYCFGVSSDYLTATATFFAAFSALYLYSDWRDQYRINMIMQLREKINLLFIDLEVKYNDFYIAIGKANNNTPTRMKDIALLGDSMSNSFELLLPELDLLIKLLKEMKIDAETLDSDLMGFETKFSEVILSLTSAFDKNNFPKTLIEYWRVLERKDFDAADYIKEQKTLLNDDLQNIFIKLFTK